MSIDYKTYWRKSGLKKNWGNIFLNIVNQHKPKVFLEVGVFCGVTARNVCELLNTIHSGQFKYVGIDLFGDKPNEDEEFGSGIEDQGFDETGRNMSFTSFKKIQQYILDAYDMLANVEDKKIFVDYLITNMKLYFDKFEQEIQKEVDEPTTQQYDSMQK